MDLPAELRLVEWLRRACPDAGSETGDLDLLIGPGDDLAELRLPGGSRVLVGTDMLLDGTHFNSEVHSPALIGRKALCAALSDCAAMAVQPVAALASIALPHGQIETLGRALMSGLLDVAHEYACRVIGGDTTSGAGKLAIDVTVLATPWTGITPVRRVGALPGDILYVTGTLGGSLLGKHMHFHPRVPQARQMAQVLGENLHAMMDISDGLALDLHRLCAASKCGAVLKATQIATVTSQDALRLSQRDGRPPLDHAFQDGEDYELLIAASPDACEQLSQLDVSVQPVGEVIPAGIYLITESGLKEELPPGGYAHV